MQAPASPRQWRWLLVAVALIGLGWFISAAGTALFPFALGLVLAYVLLPVVNGIEAVLPWPSHASLQRSLAILLVYLAVIVMVAVALISLVPTLVQQVTHFMELLPSYVERIQEDLEGWTSQYRAAVPEEVQAWVDRQVQAAVASLQGIGQSLALSAVRMVSSTVGTVIGLFIVPVWLFFVLKDQRQAMPAFYGMFPPDLRPTVRDIVFMVDYVLGRYIRAQLLLGLVVGVVTLAGLTALGVPFAPVLAVIAGIGELIPIIGPILGAIPAVLVVLATDPSRVFAVVLLFWGIQIIENNFLVPRIQGSAVQLPPPIIMILLVGAGEAIGVWGMLAAVPVAAILRDVFVYLYRRAGGHLPPTPTEQALAARVATETAPTKEEHEPSKAGGDRAVADSERQGAGVAVPPRS